MTPEQQAAATALRDAAETVPVVGDVLRGMADRIADGDDYRWPAAAATRFHTLWGEDA